MNKAWLLSFAFIANGGAEVGKRSDISYLDQIQLSCMKLFSQSTSILADIDDGHENQVEALELYTHEYPPELARLASLFQKSYDIITELRKDYSDEKMNELLKTQDEMEKIVEALKKTNRKIKKLVDSVED